MKYYHVWFPTKRKRYLLIDEIDKRIQSLFNDIAKEKNLFLLAQGTLLDHAHLLIGLTDLKDLAPAVKLFKGISARRIFQEFPILKHQLKINHFWARKYNFKEIPENAVQNVIKYIQNQKKDLYVL